MPKLKFNVPVKLTSGQVEANDGTDQSLLNKTEVEQLIDSHGGGFPLDIDDGNANDVAGILQTPTTYADGARYVSEAPVTSFYINSKQLAEQVKHFDTDGDNNRRYYILGGFYSEAGGSAADICDQVLSLCTIFFEAVGYGYPGVFLSAVAYESGIIINTTDEAVRISDHGWADVTLQPKTAYITVDNARSYFKEIDVTSNLIDQLYKAGFFEYYVSDRGELLEYLQDIRFEYFNSAKIFSDVYSFNAPFTEIPGEKKLAWMPGMPAVAKAKDGDVLSVEKTVQQDPLELNEDLMSITFNTKLSAEEVADLIVTMDDENYEDIINIIKQN